MMFLSAKRSFALTCSFAGIVGGCSAGTAPASAENGMVYLNAADDGGAATTGNDRDGGTSGDAATAFTSDSGATLGSLVVTDIADVPCEEATGPAIEVTPASPNGYPLEILGHVGSERFALAPQALDLETFSGDGAMRGVNVSGIEAVAANGSALFALGVLGADLGLQRIDLSAALSADPLGTIALSLTLPLVTIHAGAHEARAVAASDARVFTAWSAGGTVAGQLFDTSGAQVADLDFGATAAGAGTYVMRALSVDSGFVLAWTRSRDDSQVETVVRHIGHDGALGPEVSVVLASGSHSLAGAASDGTNVSLLVDEGRPTTSSVLVALDASGAVTSAVRLLGSLRGFGVAQNGENLAVVVDKGHRSALRALRGGSPVNGWKCLDDLDGTSSGYPWAAIDRDDRGWATVSWAKNGAHVLRKFDLTGSSTAL